MSIWRSRLALAIGLTASVTVRVPGLVQAAPPDRAASFGLEVRPPVAPGADGVPVRVVDAKSRQPIAGALVVAVDEGGFNYSWADLPDGTRDVPLLLRRYGAAWRAGPDGSVRIAPPCRPCLLFAWRPGLRDGLGCAFLEVHDRSEHVVAVAKSELPVEVVDANGKVQPGVPVLLGSCAVEAGFGGHASRCGVTDATGRFAIPPLDFEQAVHRTCGRRVVVEIGALVSGSFMFRPLDAPQLDPARFILPACGSVEIELRGQDGSPLAASFFQKLSLQLTAIGHPSREPRGLKRRPDEYPVSALSVEVDKTGRVRLPLVEVDSRVSLRLVAHPSHDWATVIDCIGLDADGSGCVVVRGPTKAGEVVHAVVPLRQDAQLESALEEAAQGEDREEPTEESDEPSGAYASSPEPATKDSSIELSVVTGFPIPHPSLRVRLIGKFDPEKPFDYDTGPWIDANGRATLRGVPAGRWPIAILLDRFDTRCPDVEVWRSGEIDVPASSHLRDARLLAIDLRDRLRHRRVEVVDEAGRPQSGAIRFERLEDRFERTLIAFKEGVADWLSAAADPRRGWIVVDGFRPAALDPLAGSAAGKPARVVLKRGFPVRLTLDPAALQELDSRAPLYVGVPEASRAGCDGELGYEQQDVRTVELAPDGAASFTVAEPGEWPVWFVQASGETGDDGFEKFVRLERFDATIRVIEAPGEQRFVVGRRPSAAGAR